MKFVRNLLHPILFGIYPLIYLFSENFSDINYQEMILPLLILLVIPITLFLLFKFITKDDAKSSIITTLILIIILYYRYYYQLIIGYIYITKIEIAYLGLIFIAIYIFSIIKTKKDLSVYTIFLNVFAISFMVVPLSSIIIQSYNLYGSQAHRNPGITNNFDGSKDELKIKRDIYYLVFDQYSRNDILKKYYKYDNSSFTNYLVKNGFYIADKSYANYPHTLQSLASSLNMKYINYLKDTEAVKKNDPYALFDLIQNNEIVKFLKSNNYKFIHFGSEAVATRSNNNADINFTVYSFKDNQGTIISTIYKESIISPIVIKLLKKDIIESKIVRGTRQLKKEGINFQLNKLPEIADDPDPTFVFMHLLIPHSPYVFKENGNYVSLEQEKSKTKQHNYVNQLKYLNKRLIEIIDIILSKSGPKPIIIIQSDEGHYPDGYSYKTSNLTKFSSEQLKYKFAIFNAYYFPDVDQNELYSTITPVNSFRLLFNTYFGQNYEMLEDKHFNTNYFKYYNFLDVTDKMTN